MRMLTILAIAVAAFQAGPLSAAELVPHEAEYKVTLMRYLGPGNMDFLGGSFVTRQSRDCRKWKVENELAYSVSWDGHPIDFQLNEKNYEALDGSRMEFQAWGDAEDRSKKRVKGFASFRQPGKPGIVKFTEPEALSYELPTGTLFPIARNTAIVENITAGKKQWTLSAFIYGEFGEISVTVLKSGVAAAVTPTGDTDLISGTGWVVKSASVDSGEETERTIHSNGVFSTGVTRGPLFIMRFDLVRIKRLPVPQC